MKNILLFFLCFFNLSFAQKKDQVLFYFETNSFEFSSSEIKKLDSICSILKLKKNYTLTLEGNTDKTGNAKFNKELAQNRANAVFEYLTKAKIDQSHFKFVGDQKTFYVSNEDSKNRNTILHIEYLDLIFDSSNKIENTVETDGIQVKAFTNGVSDLSITSYFSAENMIRDNIYAIDNQGNILESDGMFQICDLQKTLDATGEFYEVKMPARSGKVIDTKMTVWLDETNEKGEVVWKNTEIEIKSDAKNEYYIFKVPKTSKSCIRINLDKRCIYKNDCETIHVSTYRNFKFSEIRLTNASFSAKLNDSLFVFTKDINASISKSSITGDIEAYGTKGTIHFSLSDCKLTRNKQNIKVYQLLSSSLYHINGKPINEKKKEVKKQKKGFFTWLKNLFN